MAVDFKHKKLLIVDDFPEMRHSLRRMVQAFGVVDVDAADSGEKALDKMALKSYDIVLCDYNLGANRKDGQQTLEEARHRGLLRYSTIFMMITAEKIVEMVMGALEHKPDDYLTKPFTKEVLRTRLERLIARKNDLQDIERAARNKEFKKAIALCNQKIDDDPKNVFELYKLKSDLCTAMGDYDAAMAVYEKVLAIRGIPWARIGRGKVCFLKKDYEQAREIFQAVIDDNKMFIEAYDWLAKTLVELDDLPAAQEVLKTASELSPKAILRQKVLGDIAHRNRDYESAEKSYKSAINLGRHSYLKDPSHYTGLAKVLVDKDAPNEALNVIANVRKEFKDRPEASLQASVAEGVVYKRMNREEDAKKAIEEAGKLYDELDGRVSTDVTMEMAKACFAVGEKDKGAGLMQNVVRNHHEDERILKRAEEVFKDAELQQEGKQLIEATRQEIIEVNNKGVHLVKEGELSEAVDLFEKAANGLPENRTINLNAAQALLMYMQQNGKNDSFLRRSRQYLDRVSRINPASEKYQALLGVYEKMLAVPR